MFKIPATWGKILGNIAGNGVSPVGYTRNRSKSREVAGVTTGQRGQKSVDGRFSGHAGHAVSREIAKPSKKPVLGEWQSVQGKWHFPRARLAFSSGEAFLSRVTFSAQVT